MNLNSPNPDCIALLAALFTILGDTLGTWAIELQLLKDKEQEAAEKIEQQKQEAILRGIELQIHNLQKQLSELSKQIKA